MPASFQTLALQSEVEVSLGVALMGIGLGHPLALVPQDHRAAAVLAFRDHALEVRYSIGWSSVWTAKRFSPGTRLGPRVTAQLFRTPSSSSRKS